MAGVVVKDPMERRRAGRRQEEMAGGANGNGGRKGKKKRKGKGGEGEGG